MNKTIGYEKCKCDKNIMVLQLNMVKEVNNSMLTKKNCNAQKHLVSNKNTKVNMIPCLTAKALYHR